MQGGICTEFLAYACNMHSFPRVITWLEQLQKTCNLDEFLTWALDMVMWYWPAYTLFWQLWIIMWMSSIKDVPMVMMQMGMEYGCTYAGSWQGMTTDFLDWWVTKLFKVTEALLKCLHSSSAIIVLILCRGLSCYCSLGRDNMDHLKFQYHIDLTPQHNQTFLVIKLIRQ